MGRGAVRSGSVRREDGASGVGNCSSDADTTLAPGYDIGDEINVDEAVPLRMTMWVARPSAMGTTAGCTFYL